MSRFWMNSGVTCSCQNIFAVLVALVDPLRLGYSLLCDAQSLEGIIFVCKPFLSSVSDGSGAGVRQYMTLDADIIIKNAPDPVFVSDLEGKILLANDAVYELLGFRTDEVLEQSLSRF